MKNHIIISLLILSVGLSQKEYNYNDLIEMDNGLLTEKFSDEPISGKVYGYFGEEGNLKKVYIGNVRNGKQEGNWIWWYENGQMKFDKTFKEGKEDGFHTQWYENGQRKNERHYKDEKEDGLFTLWYENGLKRFESTFKDGKFISKKEWNEDGSVKE
jgi:uncharacterized protein